MSVTETGALDGVFTELGAYPGECPIGRTEITGRELFEKIPLFAVRTNGCRFEIDIGHPG
jgi:hypothetical protein